MAHIFKAHSFDLVMEKSASDTLQYRRKKKESNILLQKMFSEISRVLNNEYGKYLCIASRAKVPLLKLIQFKWNVNRKEIEKCGKDKQFVYLHICTKIRFFE
eukprot:326328_1